MGGNARWPASAEARHTRRGPVRGTAEDQSDQRISVGTSNRYGIHLGALRRSRSSSDRYQDEHRFRPPGRGDDTRDVRSDCDSMLHSVHIETAAHRAPAECLQKGHILNVTQQNAPGDRVRFNIYRSLHIAYQLWVDRHVCARCCSRRHTATFPASSMRRWRWL
ncbi:protein of unknown function [Rhodovastum atsumiense]|nr:protein of unknown function [Rhodovastum atsumiense]